MDICVIGAGYVGLTTSAVLAEFGHNIYCVDNHSEKIQRLQNGIVPIYEPQLNEILHKHKERVTFTTSLPESIHQSSVIFVTVGTPSLADGGTDLSFLSSVFTTLAEQLQDYKTIIIKSTIPLGTNKKMHDYLLEKGVSPSFFNIVSNPEFLREGTAIQDMFYPDRTVIGIAEDDNRSEVILKEIYQSINAPFIVTSWNSAELIKYAANAFLATKISFINEMSRICDVYDADIMEVSNGLGTDQRIGPLFLQAGIGYGGSCFPKDLQALQHSATNKLVNTPILDAVQAINATQLDFYINKLQETLPSFPNKKVTVLGIAFKPHTDDIRHSPAIALIHYLHALGADVHAYDPKAFLPAELRHKVTQHKTIKSAYLDSEAIIIATEWPEICQLDWMDVKTHLKGNIVLDGRNCINKEAVRKAGLIYKGVGRG
ncbi:UDP-glucose dehydrogenase family protein [Sutcliffiella rhizosphaerae]|uniref:UDP-glucose 6-dehydrogenase n=1 Tax=Sutcliffiella rhizosphaerae TaxID=2880967 RepID=A0ABM8YKF2_9BACI|nr:UDP-glucose/GDP-mannose dehydrogenase family protein [Sutcliffiella rhizosphaerae]CAG9620280.1 UDP-glucose 6-dehydrogenase TuaD [Sutcliffiella rhizosphaerae]